MGLRPTTHRKRAVPLHARTNGWARSRHIIREPLLGRRRVSNHPLYSYPNLMQNWLYDPAASSMATFTNGQTSFPTAVSSGKAKTYRLRCCLNPYIVVATSPLHASGDGQFIPIILLKKWRTSLVMLPYCVAIPETTEAGGRLCESSKLTSQDSGGARQSARASRFRTV